MTESLLLGAVAVAALLVVAAALWRRRATEPSSLPAAEDEADDDAVDEADAADARFLARFVHELPQVAHELHAGGYRHVPSLLLSAIVRLLEPTRATIAIARRPDAEGASPRQFTVAAVWPENPALHGSQVVAGQGEIGFAIELQWVMDRADFDRQPQAIRDRLREQTAQDQRPDVVAPMVFKNEVVGVITLEGLKRSPAETKDVLRLFALVGAVSLYTYARYSEMQVTANVDGLTGVFNKRYITARLDEEIHKALAEKRSVSVFMFDVDHFKHYNDRNGHLAGDRLLTALAKLVQVTTRRDTVIGRFGGEEFLMIFPGTAKAGAVRAAENVRQAIARFEFPFGTDQPLGMVSVSGGVAECPVDAVDGAALVRAADEALYEAKHAGRNRVAVHGMLGEPVAQPAEPPPPKENSA
ncbi:MAG TPA: GGDEF domain-containing protein [Vicinamibacteria bacterium]|nr:GGDEF domain-containing protein [Vicinamibacteria bacterium]